MDALKGILYILLSWGPWGILFIAFLDSAGIPLPQGVDALIVLVATQSEGVAYLSAALAVAGSLAGSMVLYQIGRKGGEAYLDRQSIKSRRAAKFRNWFQHYGLLTVFVPALIPAPLPLKIFVLSAGATSVNRMHFALIILAARLPRYFGEAYLGARLGTAPLEFFRRDIWWLLAASVTLFLVLFFIVRAKDRRRKLAELG